MVLDGERSHIDAYAFNAATRFFLYPPDSYQLSRLSPHQRKDFPASQTALISAQIACAAKPYKTVNHSLLLQKNQSGVLCPQELNKKPKWHQGLHTSTL